jgi:GNAT superfamily N-acetyltransferase
MSTTTIEFATPAPVLIDHLVRIVNEAYDAGEHSLWQDGSERTDTEEVTALVGRGEIAMAWRDGVPAGCVRVRRLSEDTAELGMLAVAREALGTGLGRELVAFAERHFGTPYMQLELLVPHGEPHPDKVKLHGWYTRLGYREIDRRPFAEVYPDFARLLVRESDLVIYRKTL